jgi:SpoVK/Ycf46/Vps4 family AAA+-type ATPase
MEGDWPGQDASLERLLQRIRLRAERRILWLRKLWSEEEPPGGKFAVTHGEIDTLIHDKDSPEAERDWMFSEPEAIRLTEEIERIEAVMAEDQVSRLAQLERQFGLNEEESDLFQACLAASFDPSLGRVYAYLQDHAGRGYVTEELVGRLFEHGRRTTLATESPLRKWSLIKEQEVAPGEPRLLACDPVIRDWIYGKEQLDSFLVGIARYCSPLTPLKNWPVDEIATLIKNTMRDNSSARTRVRITGASGSGRRTLASCICERLGLGLVAIDSDQLQEQTWQKVYVRAQRYAYLNNCALAWYGEKAALWRWPDTIPSFLVQFIICQPGQMPPPMRNAVDQLIQMPIPCLEERREHWLQYLPACVTWDEDSLDSLTARHRVTVGVIADVARSGVQTAHEAVTVVREAARSRLGDLVELFECPFEWDDLIVSERVSETLEDIVFEAKDRAAFWEDPRVYRLFPQGRGLFALFSGSPGTGKTMAAQVIAADLQRDLYRCDLSNIVSKWVGETSKNLSYVLNSIPNDEVILFDEADALFGRRLSLSDATDANSRFLNNETAHLLQAVENYRGVVLLSSNRKSDIDPAFVRRLRYIVDFPKPDSESRLKIWQRIIGELVGHYQLQRLDQGISVLAKEVETTGAQIKFAVLSALFAARGEGKSLEMSHLLRGLERELRKEGRALSERERERLIRHG